ncbi:MAG: class II glutamine amidotransferase [Planctomycetota bacterium]
MCRFVFYHGPSLLLSSLLTEPAHSLIRQSFAATDREEPLNGDGFGVAWYAPEITREPAAFRMITPAWNDRNLMDLARVVKSRTVLAHVRAATQVRAVNEANCHPFRSGPFAFMHNGDVGGFTHFRRKLVERLSDRAFEEIEGSTDSEHAFALLLDELGHADVPSPFALFDAVERTIDTLVALSAEFGRGEASYLNFAVTNGECAVVTRFTTLEDYDGESLYVHRGRRYVCDGGVCRMVAPDESGGAVIVSSERLSDDPGWEVVPRNHAVVVSDGGAAFRALSVTSRSLRRAA